MHVNDRTGNGWVTKVEHRMPADGTDRHDTGRVLITTTDERTREHAWVVGVALYS